MDVKPAVAYPGAGKEVGMDEAKWLACTDAEKMLAFLAGKVSDRV